VSRPAPETASLVAGVVSALGASTCCVLPLVAVSIGWGGAWIAQMRELERFFPVFVDIAIAAFGYAFYRLYLKPAPCAPDAACVTPVTHRRQRIAFWATLISAKALIIFPFVYGAGRSARGCRRSEDRDARRAEHVLRPLRHFSA
jgi:mercuric ion transport protein